MIRCFSSDTSKAKNESILVTRRERNLPDWLNTSGNVAEKEHPK
jgi:hypothetical protein